MKKYVECEYSFFYSYSSVDNGMHFSWISNFYKLLKQTTKGHIATVCDYKQPFEYTEESILHGNLKNEISKRLNKSYAYVAVIDENYINSEACNIEFNIIRQRISEPGSDALVFIFFMSELGEKKFKEKYDLNGYTYHQVYDSVKVLSTDDEPIRDFLSGIGKCIRNSVEKEINEVTIDTTYYSEPDVYKLAIAPFTNGITSDVDSLIKTLGQKFKSKISIKKIDRNELSNMGNSKNLGEYLSGFNLVLQPFSLDLPIDAFFQPGGLISTIKQIMESNNILDKYKSWYIEENDPQLKSDAIHAEYLTNLIQKSQDVSNIIENVSDELQPAEPSSGGNNKAVIYIESNNHEKMEWKTLAENIMSKWDKMNEADNTNQKLKLFPRPLDIPNIMSDPNTTDREKDYIFTKADGVIILWGDKTKRSLLDHVDFIENHTLNCTPPEGIIAYLSPPQKKNAAPVSLFWQVASFINDHPNKIIEEKQEALQEEGANDDDDNSILYNFLANIKKRKLNNLHH